MMKRALLLAPLALLALSGCGGSGKQDGPEAAATQGDAASSGPDAPAGLTVSDGVLVLPAVKGNPGVAYFALKNGSGKDAALAAVSVDGVGKAELHETVGGKMQPLNWITVNAGDTIRFERGGKHVMLFDLGDKLAAGGTAELTLTFNGGDKLSTPLKIEAAGGTH